MMKRKIFIIALLMGMLLSATFLNAEVRSRQEPGVTFYGLSSDSKPTSTFQGRTTVVGDRFFEIDTGIESVFDGAVFAVSGAATVEAVANSVSLTSPQTTVAMSVSGYNIAGYFFDIASINTSVTMILQAKTGSSAWTAFEADSTTYTTNGGKSLYSSDVAILDSMRLKWHSEAGGTAAVLQNVYQTKARE